MHTWLYSVQQALLSQMGAGHGVADEAPCCCQHRNGRSQRHHAMERTFQNAAIANMACSCFVEMLLLCGGPRGRGRSLCNEPQLTRRSPSTFTLMPRLPSSAARYRPAGPAPTIVTSAVTLGSAGLRTDAIAFCDASALYACGDVHNEPSMNWGAFNWVS